VKLDPPLQGGPLTAAVEIPDVRRQVIPRNNGGALWTIPKGVPDFT